jgi:U32 family peptidase
MENELLLPVGNMEMCLAALHYGADAIYVGVPFFNARGRTNDLSMEELKEMIDLCHLYGVKVNLAFNVVIFQNEFPKVLELLNQILPMNPDAFIVQDLGLAKLIRSIAPHQRIHASTQMTVTNPDAIELVEDLKIDRFVLGRENSIPEIKLIREKTNKELEVFVHGALCVAYSGQCFTSESLGGRSANRGQCAQSCRLPYELYVDDVKKDLGTKKYLVSPKDLMGIEEVPLLKELGVNSFKVEGRLKTPEYVAAAAKNYRDVLDGAPVNLEKRAEELSTTYSRGFFSGWLHGVNHQKLVDGTFSSHRGLHVGAILEIRNKNVLISSTTELKAGMGLLIAGEEDQGSKIFSSRKIGKNYEVELLQKNLKLQKGMKVYLNSNEQLFLELQKGWLTREKQKHIPLHFLVQGMYNEPLFVKAFDPEGREVYSQTLSFLAPAKGRPMTEDFLKEELSSLGNTVYTMGKFECFIQEGLFLNHRELKDLRRDIVEKMNKARIARPLQAVESFSLTPSEKQKVSTGLNILLRSKFQVEGLAKEWNSLVTYKDSIHSVILDFEFGKDYASSVELIRSLGLKVGIATTRILKPSEYYNLNTIIRCRPDLILVRNLGAIEYLKSKTTIPLIGDFSLNVTNSLALDYISGKGLQTVNVSYDLNQDQLMDMVHFADPSKIEVTLHQYMPEFHMEHCVFAAFLSTGTSFKDCGKPCEKHEVKLKDPYGNMHFLKADQECRNTFFKATPQSAGHLIKELAEKGVAALRLEALNETPEEVNLKILTYLKLLKEEITYEAAFEKLKVMESYGLGSGQISKSDTYKDRKKSER